MTFVVVDIESTSKFPLNAEILTVDFIVLDKSLNEVDKAGFKIRPRIWNKDAEEASKIHRITREEAYTYPPYEVAVRDMFKWLLRYNGHLVFHANRQFNSSYDAVLLRSHALYVGVYFELGLSFPERKYISTHSLSKFLNIGVENNRLDTLCKYFNIKQSNHHNSEDDVKVTSQLFKILWPKVDSNKFFEYERREDGQSDSTTKTSKVSRRQNSKTVNNRPVLNG